MRMAPKNTKTPDAQNENPETDPIEQERGSQEALEAHRKSLRDDRATLRRSVKQNVLKLNRAMALIESKYLMEPGYESTWTNPNAKAKETATRIKVRREKQRDPKDLEDSEILALASAYAKIAPSAVASASLLLRMIEQEESRLEPEDAGKGESPGAREIDLEGFMRGEALSTGPAKGVSKRPGYKAGLEARTLDKTIARLLKGSN